MSEEYKPHQTPGTVGWTEICTRDKAAAIAYYTEVCGWTTEEMELEGGFSYTMFKVGDEAVAGLVELPDEPKDAPPMWLSYYNGDDVDAAVARATAAGDTVRQERVDVSIGSFAIVTDPEGATFAFWKGNEKDC